MQQSILFMRWTNTNNKNRGDHLQHKLTGRKQPRIHVVILKFKAVGHFMRIFRQAVVK
jgi:hypothetical protein